MTADDITALARAWATGDREAGERLVGVLYDELRRLAGRHLRGERPGHTLSPTALVHEAYLRLARQGLPPFHDRAHFLGVTAHVMRQVLVDHARRRRAGKRGGGLFPVSLADGEAAPLGRSADVASLDEALLALAARDARKARAIELKYFGGLTASETASVLQVSERTVKRDLQMAEAWLHRELRRGPRS